MFLKTDFKFKNSSLILLTKAFFQPILTTAIGVLSEYLTIGELKAIFLPITMPP